MSRIVTLRLQEEAYDYFAECAKSDNRSLSNMIETAAKRYLQEQRLVSEKEMREILADKELVRRIKKGSHEGRERKGRYVD